MGGIRGKKVKGSGRTKNVSGRLPGPKYGMKCYDGQRVPSGTILLKQKILNTFPGWNITHCGLELISLCQGRVMLTTELVEPNFDHVLVNQALPYGIKDEEKLFRHYMHIIPDRQHQVFKLVDQV